MLEDSPSAPKGLMTGWPTTIENGRNACLSSELVVGGSGIERRGEDRGYLNASGTFSVSRGGTVI
jgi:hypothetical protein